VPGSVGSAPPAAPCAAVVLLDRRGLVRPAKQQQAGTQGCTRYQLLVCRVGVYQADMRNKGILEIVVTYLQVLVCSRCQQALRSVDRGGWDRQVSWGRVWC
jgi:hypothetical protein